MTAVIENYIVIDANSIAWIADTKVKVIEIALDKLAHGSSPEELHFQYPHLYDGADSRRACLLL